LIRVNDSAAEGYHTRKTVVAVFLACQKVHAYGQL